MPEENKITSIMSQAYELTDDQLRMVEHLIHLEIVRREETPVEPDKPCLLCGKPTKWCKISKGNYICRDCGFLLLGLSMYGDVFENLDDEMHQEFEEWYGKTRNTLIKQLEEDDG